MGQPEVLCQGKGEEEMSYLPRTRVIGGKTYRLHDDYLMSGKANDAADRLRQKGWNARVIYIAGLWGVYKRKGK